MNYLSTFLWPKLKQGWIHLTPASSLKFIELPSVCTEFCMELDVLGSGYCFGIFPEKKGEKARWVVIEPAGETSSHIWDQADGEGSADGFSRILGTRPPGSMLLTGSNAWHVLPSAMHQGQLSTDSIPVHHTKQKCLLTKDSGFTAQEEWTERNMKLHGYFTSRRDVKFLTTRRNSGWSSEWGLI